MCGNVKHDSRQSLYLHPLCELKKKKKKRKKKKEKKKRKEAKDGKGWQRIGLSSPRVRKSIDNEKLSRIAYS